MLTHDETSPSRSHASDHTAEHPKGEQQPQAPIYADVLVVDDQRINLVVVKKLIEKEGYSVETAATGAEALELLRSRPYRLLLLDMSLPDMHGLEVVRSIRRAPDASAHSESGEPSPRELPDRNMPIVMLTAYGGDQDRQDSHEAGADEYVVKPLNRETLRGIFERVASRSRHEEPGESVERGEETNSPAVFDPTELEARLGGISLSQTVAKRFLESLDRYAAAVDEAAASEDLAELRSAAHNLASPAANVGASALRSLCKSIEAAAAEGNRQEAHRHAARLHSETAAARREIEKFVSQETSSRY